MKKLFAALVLILIQLPSHAAYVDIPDNFLSMKPESIASWLKLDWNLILPEDNYQERADELATWISNSEQDADPLFDAMMHSYSSHFSTNEVGNYAKIFFSKNMSDTKIQQISKRANSLYLVSEEPKKNTIQEAI